MSSLFARPQFSSRWTKRALVFVLGLTLMLIVIQLHTIQYKRHLQQPQQLVVNDATGSHFRLDTPTTSAFPTAPPPTRHVIGRMRMNGGRLGNEMFVYASVLGIADRNRMLPVYRSDLLRSTFENVTADSRSSTEVGFGSMSIVEYSAFQYDQRLEKLSTMSLGDVTVIGFFQSWKYFRDVATRVRSEFQFRSEVQKGATDFLRDISAKHSLLACDTLYIGVHIRRGDMLASYNTQKGYTVADDAYLRRAVSYFTHRFAAGKRLVYVVCSDDLPWAEAHFVDAVAAVWNDTAAGVNNASGLLTWLKSAVSGLVVARNGETRDLFFAGCNHSSVSAPRNTASLSPDVNISSPARVSTINTTSSNANSGSLTSAAASAGASNAPVVVMSREHTTEQDLAILSACNHTIMTVGTYGWWAGYLAGGTTVYLRNFPAARSELDRWFSRDDFFPPDWIGL